MNLFALLNIDHPLVAWEVAIGRLFSAGTARDGTGVSLFMYNRLACLAQNPKNHIVHNEFILEGVRQKDFPESVSRLGGLYFLESKEDALRANKKFGFRYPESYICKIDFDCDSFSKVDSNWITYCIGTQKKDWMERYWAGEPYNDSPLYEIIAKGKGYIEDVAIREKAYGKYFFSQPDTSPLLSMSCCAFSRGGFDDISRTVPFLMLSNNIIKGTFLIDMHTLNTRQSEVELALADCAKHNEFPLMKLPKEKDAFFRVPYHPRCSFELSVKDNELIDIQPHFGGQ